MAFLYLGDLAVYDDDFHFWYVYGCYPDPALKVERVVEPEEKIVVSNEEESRITHPVWEVNGRPRRGRTWVK